MLAIKPSSSTKSLKARIKSNATVPIIFLIVVVILCPLLYYCYFCYFNVKTKVQCKYITVTCSEKTEDHLLQYMYLYTQWKKNEEKLYASNFIPIIPIGIHETMSGLFQNFSIPTFNENCRNTIFNEVAEVNSIPAVLDNTSYELRNWRNSYPELIKYGIKNIKRDLHFHKHLLGKVNTILGRIAIKFGSKPIIVCIDYTGQTDKYVGVAYNDLPTYRYYVLAMEYFKNKYKNVAFIFLASDDMWQKENIMPILSNGIVVLNPIRTTDGKQNFVLMASCDHNIISYGISAINAALLAGGETITYAKYKNGSNFDNFGDAITVAKHMQKEWLVGNNTYIGKYLDFYG